MIPAVGGRGAGHDGAVVAGSGVAGAGVAGGKLKKWTPQQGKNKAKFTASLGLTTTISASVRVTASATCTPSKALRKVAAARFTIDGIVVTVEPDFYLTIDANGLVTASQAVTQTVALSGKLGVGIPTPSYHITKGKPTVTSSGAADFTAAIGGEARIQAGVLSLDFELMGGVAGVATLESGHQS